MNPAWLLAAARWCALVLTTTLFVGCAHDKMSSSNHRPATSQAIAALGNIDLNLERLVVAGEEVKLSADKPIIARFLEGSKFAGQGPVNRFTSGFELGADGSVAWPKAGLISTRMAGPPEAMALEQTLLNALTSTTLLELSGKRAVFRSADDTTRLEFSVPGR